MSCAYKHILAYQSILKQNDEYALILEDDIILGNNFCDQLALIVKEVQDRRLTSFLISLEDSNRRYVKGSRQKSNIRLYRELSGRMAGAYLIDKACAQKMITEIIQHKCHLPIDWFHNRCSENGLINIYWAHPTLAIQGSINGTLKSLIDRKKHGTLRVFTFQMSRLLQRGLHRLK